MKDFLNQLSGAEAGVISDAPSIGEILLNVLQFLLSVVAIVAILATVIAGIRYIVHQDTDQASGAKKSLVAIVGGLILILGAFIIVSAIGRFLQ